MVRQVERHREGVAAYSGSTNHLAAQASVSASRSDAIITRTLTGLGGGEVDDGGGNLYGGGQYAGPGNIVGLVLVVLLVVLLVRGGL